MASLVLYGDAMAYKGLNKRDIHIIHVCIFIPPQHRGLWHLSETYRRVSIAYCFVEKEKYL